MSFHQTPQEIEFRAEARAWLDEHAPPFVEKDPPLSIFAPRDPDGSREMLQMGLAWQREKHDGGWAGIQLPTEHGGAGRTLLEHLLFVDEEGRHALPLDVMSPTTGMVGPTIATFGTEHQKETYLRPLLRGDALWCQLFSEPGAGSDLASLRTTAKRTDDGWVVNGQKVWTSYAQYASYAYLLARTDPDAPKHRGISAFILDMDQPGIEVRPLRQATGAVTFNEVFLQDVHVPEENLLGELNNGWQVTTTTLATERFAHHARVIPVMPMAELIAQHPDPERWFEDLGRAIAGNSSVNAMKRQFLSGAARGMVAGPEGSIAKLVTTDTQRALWQAAQGVLGADSRVASVWTDFAVGIAGMRIGAGTDEILKGILASRVLGLPR